MQHFEQWTRAIGLLVCAVVCAPGVASAQVMPAPSAAEASDDADVAARIDWIQHALDAGRPASDRWYYTWLLGQSASAVGQGVAGAFTTDETLRPNLWVSAATSLVGALPMVIWPMRAISAPGDLRAVSAATPAARRFKLRFAERLLRESAEGQRVGRAWWNHVLGGAVALASGLVMWLGFEQLVSGVLNAVGGVALAELQIFTQPMAAADAERDYRAMRSAEAVRGFRADRAPRGRDGVQVRVSVHAAGVGLSLQF